MQDMILGITIGSIIFVGIIFMIEKLTSMSIKKQIMSAIKDGMYRDTYEDKNIDKRYELVSKELELPIRNIIISRKNYNSFDVMCNKGNYVVVFDDSYNKIEKIVKVEM